MGRSLVERRDHFAARADALADAAGEFEIRQGIGLLHNDPARQWSRSLRAGKMQNLFEILRYQESDLGAFFLQYDVGRHRRAMEEGGNFRSGHAAFLEQLLNSVQNSNRLVAWGRGRFEQAHPAGALVK